MDAHWRDGLEEKEENFTEFDLIHRLSGIQVDAHWRDGLEEKEENFTELLDRLAKEKQVCEHVWPPGWPQKAYAFSGKDSPDYRPFWESVNQEAKLGLKRKKKASFVHRSELKKKEFSKRLKRSPQDKIRMLPVSSSCLTGPCTNTASSRKDRTPASQSVSECVKKID